MISHQLFLKWQILPPSIRSEIKFWWSALSDTTLKSRFVGITKLENRSMSSFFLSLALVVNKNSLDSLLYFISVRFPVLSLELLLGLLLPSLPCLISMSGSLLRESILLFSLVMISVILFMLPKLRSISWFLWVRSRFKDSFSLKSSFKDYLNLSFGFSITFTSFSKMNSTLFSSALTFFVFTLLSFFSELSSIMYLLFSSCNTLILCNYNSIIFCNSAFFSCYVTFFLLRCLFSSCNFSISLELVPNSISFLAAAVKVKDNSYTASLILTKSLSFPNCYHSDYASIETISLNLFARFTKFLSTSSSLAIILLKALFNKPISSEFPTNDKFITPYELRILAFY